jgi:RimJ/RimL family protein N-acetyltransferase
MSRAAFSIRRAEDGDSAFLLSLRNSPAVRMQSRNAGEIGPIEHENWFKSALTDSLETILIVIHEERPGGYVRATKKSDFSLMSIAISPALRGKGLCSEIIFDALKLIEAERLVAEVLEGNAPSLACFSKSGFRLISSKNGLKTLELIR